MIFTTNAFRRAAAGAALVLSALAIPAVSSPASASTVYGPYSDLRWCSIAASAYGGPQHGAYCFLRDGRWYLMTP